MGDPYHPDSHSEPTCVHGYKVDEHCRDCATNNSVEVKRENELITETDTHEAFAEKFASSLESQADEMTEAMESFETYPDVVGGFMATASWLRRTAKAIREIV